MMKVNDEGKRDESGGKGGKEGREEGKEGGGKKEGRKGRGKVSDLCVMYRVHIQPSP